MERLADMDRDNATSGEGLPVPHERHQGDLAKPPHPLDGRWHINVEGRTFGPYTGHELKDFVSEGRLEHDTQVSRLGTEVWTEADIDPRLKPFFPAVERPPLVASRTGRGHAESGTVHTGDNGTVVQVTNHIQTPVPAIEFAPDKSPGLALFLSLVIVGLGQLYNGDVLKGILMFFACILLWVVFLGWVINIWSIVDAYGRAKELRTRHRTWMGAARPA